MLYICLKKKLNFTGRINAFRVIERIERMNILGGQNNESVNIMYLKLHYSIEIEKIKSNVNNVKFKKHLSSGKIYINSCLILKDK